MTIRHRSDLMGDMDESEGYMRNKWSEQEMIQTRRSVSSSPSSESETNDVIPEHDSSKQHAPSKIAPQSQQQQQQPPMAQMQPQAMPTLQNDLAIQNALAMRVNEMAMNEGVGIGGVHGMPDMLPYPSQQQAMQQQQQQQQHAAGQMNQYSYPNENGPVSLFPPSGGSLNTQIPFPSPGAAMFPPNFVNAYAAAAAHPNQQQQMQQQVSPQQQQQQQQKTGDSAIGSLNYPANLCASAAFTSSSRNIALATSMMAPSPVQNDAQSQISSPNNTNMPPTQIPSHVTGNNNNNNVSSPKIDYNRRKCLLLKLTLFLHLNFVFHR